MLTFEKLHHVAVPVTDLARAKRFYGEVVGLRELPRPPFDFAGAWYAVNEDQQLHLVVHPPGTFRVGKPVDTRDIHCAIRVSSWRAAVAHFHALGYTPDAADEMHRTREQPHATAGFP